MDGNNSLHSRWKEDSIFILLQQVSPSLQYVDRKPNIEW